MAEPWKVFSKWSQPKKIKITIRQLFDTKLRNVWQEFHTFFWGLDQIKNTLDYKQTLHSGSKWLKSAKNIHLMLYHEFCQHEASANSQSFRFRPLLNALYIQNLSNHKYDQSISRIFNSIFGRILLFGPTVPRD